MVNNSSISTTQSLDRLVGTAAIIGLSLAVVLQWLSSSPSSDENDVFMEEGSNPQQEEDERYTAAAPAAASPSRRKIDGNNSNKSTSSSSSWWWPLTIMRRRTKKRRKQRISNKDEDNDNIANHPRNLDGSCNTNEDSSSCDEGYCDHLGSCQCGSIRFIVSNIFRHNSHISKNYTFQFSQSRLTTMHTSA